MKNKVKSIAIRRKEIKRKEFLQTLQLIGEFLFIPGLFFVFYGFATIVKLLAK